MTSEQTGGSTVRELMDENANLKADYAVACDTADRQAYEINKQDATIATLTAENERLSARVERLESAGNALIDYANKPGTPSMPSQIYVLLDQLLAAIEGRTARRELEEGK